MMKTVKHYAVVGHPVSHSLSPEIHSLFARQTNLFISYKAVDVAPCEFDTFVNTFFEAGHGLNITMPYKKKAWQLAKRIDCAARESEAVNTLWVDSEGNLSGSNTDGKGLVRDIKANLGICLKGKRLLVLGAGGAVCGVLKPLLDERPESVILVNRTMEKAEKLAEKYSDKYNIRAGIASETEPFDILVNGAASLDSHFRSTINCVINDNTVVYDINYDKRASTFYKWMKSRRVKEVHNGLGMLVEQAAEAFNLWHGVRPETAQVIKTMRKNIKVNP